MEDKLMLMIPGPTPVPEQALLALAKAPIGHRSGDFSKVMADVTAKLKWLHQTTNDVLILTVSGTGANKEIKAVIITHSETSTGVLNDLVAINRYVKAHEKALIIVDAVTSLGAMNVPIDELGLDVVGSGSQKGYMIPPGLGFVAVSPKAWEAYKTANLPRFYLDLGKARKDAAKNSTPFTTSVNMVMALQASLEIMQREGLENIFARHLRHREATRAAVKALNLSLLAPDDAASASITSVVPPEGLDAEKIRATIKKKFDIVMAGGQDHLNGKIFRIGHLGFVGDRDILTAIAALEASISALGYTNFTYGAGVKAAIEVLNG